VSILRKFLETNCDLDVRNEEGATPVYISCQYGQTNCLQLLLNYGANAEITVDTGDTPLNIACQEGYYDCVVILLNHGTYKFLVQFIGTSNLLVNVVPTFTIGNICMNTEHRFSLQCIHVFIH
jgi:ankyrin repeat protein